MRTCRSTTSKRSSTTSRRTGCSPRSLWSPLSQAALPPPLGLSGCQFVRLSGCHVLPGCQIVGWSACQLVKLSGVDNFWVITNSPYRCVVGSFKLEEIKGENPNRDVWPTYIRRHMSAIENRIKARGFSSSRFLQILREYFYWFALQKIRWYKNLYVTKLSQATPNYFYTYFTKIILNCFWFRINFILLLSLLKKYR